MRKTVKWASEAISDLVEILDYIQLRNPLAAQDLYETIALSVEKLPMAPQLFRPGRIEGTREMVVHPNYIVVYQVLNADIEVLRVLHSRQRYP